MASRHDAGSGVSDLFCGSVAALGLALNEVTSDVTSWHCTHWTGRDVVVLSVSGAALAQVLGFPVSEFRDTAEAHCQASPEMAEDFGGGPCSSARCWGVSRRCGSSIRCAALLLRRGTCDPVRLLTLARANLLAQVVRGEARHLGWAGRKFDSPNGGTYNDFAGTDSTHSVRSFDGRPGLRPSVRRPRARSPFEIRTRSWRTFCSPGGREKERKKERKKRQKRREEKRREEKRREEKREKRREDKTRQDKTRQDKTRQDKTRQDKTRQDKTRQDKTRQDKTRQDKTRQDKTRQDKTRQDKTRQDKTRQDKTRQDKTRQDKGREGKGREGKGKGREGKGREGKGREGKGREGKGREGKGREGKGREGKGREGKGKGREGKGREGKGREGREGKGREGKGREGKGREGKGREGKGREGKGREGKGREGKGREDKRRQEKTREDKRRQEKTREDKKTREEQRAKSKEQRAKRKEQREKKEASWWKPRRGESASTVHRCVGQGEQGARELRGGAAARARREKSGCAALPSVLLELVGGTQFRPAAPVGSASFFVEHVMGDDPTKTWTWAAMHTRGSPRSISPLAGLLSQKNDAVGEARPVDPTFQRGHVCFWEECSGATVAMVARSLSPLLVGGDRSEKVPGHSKRVGP